MKEFALKVPGPSGSPLEIQAPGVPNVEISPIIQTAVTVLFIGAILLTLFFLVFGGIRMIVSGGDKQQVVNARQTLTYAVVGLIIVLFSFFIVNLIGGLFGVNLLSIP